MLKFAAITPHPPVIIPTIGSRLDLRKTSKTIESMKKIAPIFVKSQPETAIIISPHGPIEYQQVTINISPTLFGNFNSFGDYETHFSFENDLEIVNLLHEKCNSQKIPLRLLEEPQLDHGSLVPLYYLTKNYKKALKLVQIAYAYPDKEINFNFGRIIHETCSMKPETKKKNIAIIASGDLSHCLTFEAPGGFTRQGGEFDKTLIQFLDKNNTEGVLNIDSNLIKKAGECGYLSIVMLLGAIEAFNKTKIIRKAKFESLSYEGPFGVGYLVGYYKL